MAVMNTIPAKCTNKLCDYEGSISYVNNNYPTEKGVCPKCGFKTLDSNLASWIRFGWAEDYDKYGDYNANS